ncbi:BZ3500_MvSof-1268-A1-R1_Chr6-2g08517 [Microbotryum saponariae]|uniref:BZ3500_MvSof-1268-A1-R1_Chr6-2g08517 protein n=1 Tax=Microbotryum saponariae TaxID=289078 RepID=A0A2X0KIH9_9BASI|nr:BZ3500_MvSof-1268-A1-R1_Chr6-2g08517 [Microbotryum saponariae]SDA07794.1 BZ3501_MvSof-1269-A2-R1_Chr6-1g08231 [Microbotryum saponariae]
MAQVPPPSYLTYIPPAAPLPSWLKYTSSPIATSTLYYTVETLLDGTPTVRSGAVVVTKYLTQIIQLPLTVDVPYKVAAPYTNAGGTGPTVVSILGATGSGATFILAASMVSATTPTAAPFPTPAAAPQEPATTAQPVSAPTGDATPSASSFNNVSVSVSSATDGAAIDPSSASNTLPAPPTSTIPEVDSAAFPATAAQSATPNSDSASSPATPQPGRFTSRRNMRGSGY